MILTLIPPYSPCILVSESGRILNKWHDPTGHLSRTSHCEKHHIHLYMGSYNHWGIGRLYLAAELPEKMKNDRPFLSPLRNMTFGQRIFKDDEHKKQAGFNGFTHLLSAKNVHSICSLVVQDHASCHFSVIFHFMYCVNVKFSRLTLSTGSDKKKEIQLLVSEVKNKKIKKSYGR